MLLIITKDNEYLELEDTVKIKSNEFGVWFWFLDCKKFNRICK